MTATTTKRQGLSPVAVVALVVAVVAAMALLAALVAAVTDEPAPPSIGDILEPEGDALPAAAPAAVPGENAAGLLQPALQQGGGGGRTVELPGGLRMRLPQGWSTNFSDNGTTAFFAEGADYWVTVYDLRQGGGDAADVMIAYIDNVLSQSVSNVEFGDPVEREPPPGINDFLAVAYSGYLVSQSGGNVPVEGVVFGMTTPSGLGIVVEASNGTGRYDTYADDYAVMTGSIIPSAAGA